MWVSVCVCVCVCNTVTHPAPGQSQSCLCSIIKNLERDVWGSWAGRGQGQVTSWGWALHGDGSWAGEEWQKRSALRWRCGDSPPVSILCPQALSGVCVCVCVIIHLLIVRSASEASFYLQSRYCKWTRYRSTNKSCGDRFFLEPWTETWSKGGRTQQEMLLWLKINGVTNY